jgi:hypothetical protein
MMKGDVARSMVAPKGEGEIVSPALNKNWCSPNSKSLNFCRKKAVFS